MARHVVISSGYGADGQINLWETDGTAADTVELTGIAGAGMGGVNPSDLTAFDDGLLFNGRDAAGNLGLWRSNGTSSGTRELTGITGANSAGLNPSDLTAFNNELLF